MKKLIFITFLSLFTFYTVEAQKGSGFGLRAGLNYNTNGNLYNSAQAAYQNPDGTIGFHVGVFGKLALGRLYLKPELVYTKTKSEYDTSNFNLQKIDLPILVGVKIIGPLHGFAGPALQYILDTELDNNIAKISTVKNDVSVGFNFGVGVNLSKIGIDLRYERGFSDNEATIIANNSSIEIGRLETRPSQFILSLSYNLF